MKYIVLLKNKIDIINYKLVDGFLCGHQDFAMNIFQDFTLSDFKKIKKQNKELYVLVNKLFYDEDLDKVKKYLEELKKIDVDGIYFSDFSVFMLAKELNMLDKLIFYHETFLKNTMDIITYESLNIKKIVISKDMTIDDILKLPNNNYALQVFGYFPIYYSKRKVLSTHKKKYKLNYSLNDDTLKIREINRTEYHPIIEKRDYSVIYSNIVLCYINEINMLKSKVDTFIFNSLFLDSQYVQQVISFFKEGNSSIDEIQKVDNKIELSTYLLHERIGDLSE